MGEKATVATFTKKRPTYDLETNERKKARTGQGWLLLRVWSRKSRYKLPPAAGRHDQAVYLQARYLSEYYTQRMGELRKR